MRCFQVNADDNVATALDDIAPGPVAILGAVGEGRLDAAESISLGHKISLRPIAVGAAIVKFGVPIGVATVDIPAGHWVHLQNCRSQVDERSAHLDITTGAALDTVYG